MNSSFLFRSPLLAATAVVAISAGAGYADTLSLIAQASGQYDYGIQIDANHGLVILLGDEITSDEQIQPYFTRVPVKIEVSGRYHQLAKFFAGVGRLDRIINVENIELTDPKLVGDEMMLKGKCLATAFHALKPKEAPRGPGTPAPPGTPPSPAGSAGGAK